VTPAEEFNIQEKIRKGDPAALADVYDCLGHKLYIYLLTILRSESAAEETLQNLFVTIARKRELLLKASNLTGYLFRMARNHALDFRRRQRPADEPLAAYEAVLVWHDDSLAIERREEWAAVLRALDHLPFEQQEVINLKNLQGLTFDEIGQALNISRNTAASRYRYGLQRLREILPKSRHES
jgi:RNA polymerase sigma-70 factor, ECF subfamily